MRLMLALAFGLIAGAGQAKTLMTADEYEAWSMGQTLDYAIDGTVYGSERHLPGRKTLDADLGEPCTEGIWFPQGDAICFVYAGHDGTHCWHFWREGGQVLAKPVWRGRRCCPAHGDRLTDPVVLSRPGCRRLTCAV